MPAFVAAVAAVALIFAGPVAADENRPSKADLSGLIRNIEEALEISKAEKQIFTCGKKFVTFLSFDTRRVVTIAKTRIIAIDTSPTGSVMVLSSRGGVSISKNTHKSLIDCLN